MDGAFAPRVPAVDALAHHPCFSEDAHHHFARLHLAVAPACNIQCNYCNRKFDCSNESRPGVVSHLLTPEEAAARVLTVASVLPQLAVVGIAGPGDPLANPARTFETLERVRKVAPDLTLCLSTNGLALPDHVETIAALEVGHVTITLNTLDAETGARIYPWVFHAHRRLRGRYAAAALIERQLEGLERLVERGVLVKVNSVLIPGVNDAELPEVARAVSTRGAFVHNVMPLISDPAHGTAYGLAGLRGPSDSELEAVRESCGGDMRLMRHCRQCRADAVGMLGQDEPVEALLERMQRMETVDPVTAQSRRAAYRAHVAGKAATPASAACASECTTSCTVDCAPALRVAVVTEGEGLINRHFGHATEFLVYDTDGQAVRFIGVRKVENYCTGPAGCGDRVRALEGAVAALHDCRAILCELIGYHPWKALERAGIEPVIDYAMEPIEASIRALHASWSDAGRLETELQATG